MVAIKPAHQKLTPHEIFRGILWEDGDVHQKEKEYSNQLVAEGWDHKDFGFHFEVSKMMRKYYGPAPTYRERQEAMKKIYPPVTRVSCRLDEAEINYLLGKLQGVNDHLGQDIIKKLLAAGGRLS